MSDDHPCENQLITERREKLQALRAQGVAFPNDFKPTHHAAELHHRHGQVPNEELEPQAVKVSVAGRLMLKRVMGKACFGTLQDGTGRIQLYITQDLVGADALVMLANRGEVVLRNAPAADQRQAQLAVTNHGRDRHVRAF